MPLLDHFHPPLSLRRHWHAFHNAWATYIASDLNRRLPEGYFAEPNVQFEIEIDIATFKEPLPVSESRQAYEISSPSTASGAEWKPPLPVHLIPFQLIGDIVEVAIFSSDTGPTLVGVIELVSPANKDRATHRTAFVSKCETYLRQGIVLAVVDIVTNRQANLHNELLARLEASDVSSLEANLYAVAYRPVESDGEVSLAIWQEILAVSQPLPALPLWLGETLCLPVDLEATYERTGQEQRITTDKP